MKEFMMIFRTPPSGGMSQSAEEMQAVLQQWQNWIGGIAAEGKFSSTNRLSFTEGKTLQSPSVITDGPYAEVKEFVGGYLIVKTEGIDEAVELAKGCPVFAAGGNVEVREIFALEM